MTSNEDELLSAKHAALVDAIESDGGNQLTLDRQLLGRAGITGLSALFRDTFGISSLAIQSDLHISEQVVGNSFVIRGTGLDIDIRLTFRDVADELEIEVFLTAEATATLEKQLPGTKGLFASLSETSTISVPGIASTLRFEDARYSVVARVTSARGTATSVVNPGVTGTVSLGSDKMPLTVEVATEHSGWRVGLPDEMLGTFRHVALLMPELILAEHLPPPLRAVDKLKLLAFDLQIIPGFDSMNAVTLAVQIADEPEKSVWEIAPGVVELTNVHITLSLNVDEEAKQIRPTGTGWIDGDFVLGGKLTARGEISLPITDSGFSLTANPNVAIPDFGDLAGLIPGGAFGELLPGELADLGGFTLESLSMQLPPGQMGAFTIVVASTSPWSIIKDRVSLEDIRMRLSVAKPSGGRPELTGQVYGRFRIGEAVVMASVGRYDAQQPWEFHVISPFIPLPGLTDLTALIDVDLTDELKSIGLDDPQFTIRDLSIDIQFGKRPSLDSIGFALRVEGEDRDQGADADGDGEVESNPLWELIPGLLSLNDFEVGFKLDYSPTEPIRRKGWLAGTVLLAEHNVNLIAELGDDIEFRGSVKPSAKKLSVIRLIEDVIPGDDVLPDNLPNILFEDLDATFSAPNAEFHSSFAFSGTARVELEDFLENPVVDIRLPETARFAFGVSRERTPKLDGAGQPAKAAPIAMSIIAKIDKGDSLSVSTGLGWNRDVGDQEFSELQNDEAVPPDQLIGVTITATEDVAVTLIERAPDGGGKAKYFTGFDPSKFDITFNLLGLSYTIDGSRIAGPNQDADSQQKVIRTDSETSSGDSGDSTVPSLNTPADETPSVRVLPSKPKKRPLPKLASKTPSKKELDRAKEGKEFTLPFLAQGAATKPVEGETAKKPKSNPLGKLSQYIRIRPPTAEQLEMDGTEVSLSVPATILIGSLEFDTELPMSFDMSTMAFSVSHPKGIKVMSSRRDLLEKVDEAGTVLEKKNKLFGLTWDFFGTPVDDQGEMIPEYEKALQRENNDQELLRIAKQHEADGERFHHLTLVTKDMDYQIQQAPGARIEISYTKVSKEPIVFGVSKFALSSAGLSVTAEVLDRPAELNGVATKFRFSGSKLVIVDNQVKDLTLSGSGPLPPKLVGDAMADISLQFKSVNDKFTLVAGSAELKGNKLLSCDATRFQFQLDAIGLKFVNDGGFHMFFTLTGKARLVLAKGDSKSGALSMLPSIEMELNECPLTGDASVLAKHISFLVELPRPVSFPFLGAYEYELRAIGFNPKFDKFGDDPAMMLSGQIKFAKGKGDVADQKPDLHKLYIGLPEKGKLMPRLYMDKLPLNINMGDAFKLNGTVEFVDRKDEKGFSGEGVLEIKGLPPIAAAFGFFRLQRSDGTWVRAWFIYIEARHLSFRVPYLEFYLREIGLGFGYRYTLTGIKAADKANDLKQMIVELREISKTQGDLSKRSQWARDVEEPGENARWTIVLRAMFAQSTAAVSPIGWKKEKEETLPCAYLFDVVASFRSDLTFFMTARGWINTNYYDFDLAREQGQSLQPFVSGFILLSARHKRLLAHVASNPTGHLGSRPALPAFVEEAMRGARFSATMLLEPGLAHMELGWPNMLRWDSEIGPLKVERRGGFIFRITDNYILIGISCMQRGTLDVSASIDLGLVGASLSAKAHIAMGARLMALLEYNKPAADAISVYGAMGLDLQIAVAISLWIKIPLLVYTLELSFSFSFELGFTAALEFGVRGPTKIGVRGKGRVSVKLMGHQLSFAAQFSFNDDVITAARLNTEKYMSVGLEATEVDTSLPGVDERPKLSADAGAAAVAPYIVRDSELTSDEEIPGVRVIEPVRASTGTSTSADETDAAKAAKQTHSAKRLKAKSTATASVEGNDPEFAVPNYSALAVSDGVTSADATVWYFALVPAAESIGDVSGFLPVPPEEPTTSGLQDFVLSVPEDDSDGIQRFSVTETGEDSWEDIAWSDSREFGWSVNWQAEIFDGQNGKSRGFEGVASDSDASKTTEKLQESSEAPKLTLAQYLAQAFVPRSPPASGSSTDKNKDLNRVVLARDPRLPANQTSESLEDARIENPSDDSYESAVRGAVEQFRGSPFFKHDPTREYDKLLAEAFGAPQDADAHNSNAEAKPSVSPEDQQALQVRGLVIQSIIDDVHSFVASGDPEQWIEANAATSVAFQMGLVFRVKGDAPKWLRDRISDDALRPQLRQRRTRRATSPNGSPARPIVTFNPSDTDFGQNPPQFQQVRQYTDAGTIALAWKLYWTPPDDASRPTGQDDPEHHLLHYLVKRRDMDGREAEKVSRVKPADVVHESDRAIRLLRPRFQIVDQFGHESAQDLADLPASGRSYLYTVTPVDLSGNYGQPLTLVATRYPNEPPPVPVDAKFTVDYRLTAVNIRPDETGDAPPQPRLLIPSHMEVAWTEAEHDSNRPRVAVEERYLIFRRQRTMPIGSYGLDSESQRKPADMLPTTNARALPTDIKVSLDRDRRPGQIFAKVLTETLREKGVFPNVSDDSTYWRPESWRVFIQTVSANDVPSPLVPVEIAIRFSAPGEKTGANTVPGLEERSPAELEWLPRPLALPMLPPEDLHGTTGVAHVPMPSGVGADQSGVTYRSHPERIRCVQMRWNQGPSRHADYPIDLSSSYDIMELDADSHTAKTFDDDNLIANAVRQIQGVQMIPPGQMRLIPSDTLTTNQWEAWYPSHVRRVQRLAQLAGSGDEEQRQSPLEWPAESTAVYAPWYSWRESILVWPKPPETVAEDNSAEREAAGESSAKDPSLAASNAALTGSGLHPFLQDVLSALRFGQEAEAIITDATSDRPAEKYMVDVQPPPPLKPEDIPKLFELTAPDSDPYGWKALQMLGLSMTVSLRELHTGALVDQELLAGTDTAAGHVDTVINGLIKLNPELQPHVFVEWLYQPGRSVQLTEQAATVQDMLGIVQISLRPAIQQVQQYGVVRLVGGASEKKTLSIELKGQFCSLFDQANPDAGQVDLEMVTEGDRVQTSVTLPMDGETNLFLRADPTPPAPAPPVRPEGTAPATETTVVPQALPDPLPTVFVINEDGTTANTTTTTELAVIDVSAEDSASPYFTYSPTMLAKAFTAEGTDAHTQWQRFAIYIQQIWKRCPGVPGNPTETTAQSDAKGLQQDLTTISTEKLGAEILPEFLPWAKRFFTAAAVPLEPTNDNRSDAVPGPWVAAAYPRVESPAHAAPDAQGRLTYHHLVRDGWAHAWRYYIQPTDRYGLLWQSLLESPALFPVSHPVANLARETAAIIKTVSFDAEAGGLDVVLDRTNPVDMPLVLSSQRLDPVEVPGQPVPPGAYWEVIVAQHREQALMERNQIVSRRLSYRQISFTLLRSFAFSSWVQQLEHAVNGQNSDSIKTDHRITLSFPQDVYPKPPQQLPTELDHLPLSPLGDVTRELTLAESTSLDLPERLGSFQQGAMVLQWQGLPFFYEHQLQLVAQSSTTVSPINVVQQKDFEFRSPLPQAWMKSNSSAAKSEDSPVWQLEVPLSTFWDSLPDSAQQQWPQENPQSIQSSDTDRSVRPASLPDKDVVYQILAIYGGNLELQAELLFDEAAAGTQTDPEDFSKGRFIVRQLGKRFLFTQLVLAPPSTGNSHGEYTLTMEVSEETDLILHNSEGYSAKLLKSFSDSKGSVKFKDSVSGADDSDTRPMSISGQMSRRSRNGLLLARIPLLKEKVDDDLTVKQQEQLIDDLYATREVSSTPDIPESLAERVRYRTDENLPEEFQSWISFLGNSYLQLLAPLTDDEAVELQTLLEIELEPKNPDETDDEKKEREKTNRQNLVTRLRNDLRDRKAIDQAYRSWLHEEPVTGAATVPTDSPFEVHPVEGYVLCWDEDVSSDALDSVDGIVANEAFKNGIQRLRKLAVEAISSKSGVRFHTTRVSGKEKGLPPSPLPSGLTTTSSVLRYHGNMSTAEATAMQRHLSGDFDRKAVARLYARSNTQRSDVELKLLSKRGSAPPSAMVSPAARPLPSVSSQ